MSDNTDLKLFFEPRGIALVGARHSPGFGYGIPLTLKEQGWGGRLFLVNPRGGELHGFPLYPTLADVPGPVDLAVVIVPAAQVPRVMEEVGERGIRHVVLESAGFAEVGEEGRALQQRVWEVAERYGIRVIGPNCVGLVNTANLLTTVEILPESLVPGNVSIIAQSGVFGNILLDMLYQYSLYISKAVTLGNRMDVDENEVLDYLHRDTDTRVIMMYLEGARNGRLLKETLRRVARDKPVLVLKSGRTREGRSATASHTGSMSGEDRLYDAAFEQSGAMRMDSLESLVESARVFATQPLPRGNRLGIVTGSGSLGVMATDAAVSSGLVVEPLSREAVEKVKRDAPAFINIRNPLDLGPTAIFQTGLRALLEDPDIDMVLGITIIPYAVVKEMAPLGITPAVWFGDIAAVREEYPDKPLVVCVVGNAGFVEEIRRISGPRVPVFVSPEPAARALASLHTHARRLGAG
jgi:acyl-CoA synthetase (NDP forming)